MMDFTGGDARDQRTSQSRGNEMLRISLAMSSLRCGFRFFGIPESPSVRYYPKRKNVMQIPPFRRAPSSWRIDHCSLLNTFFANSRWMKIKHLESFCVAKTIFLSISSELQESIELKKPADRSMY